MSDHTYKFNISMSCGGCSGAVERVLKKLDGIPFPFPFLVSPRLPAPLRSARNPLTRIRCENLRCESRVTNGEYYDRTGSLV